MKLISARASRAPAPLSTENRAPAILRRRARSRGCRAPGRDPSAPAAEVERRAARRRGAPRRCRRRSCPTGTLACGRFGSVSSSAGRAGARPRRAGRSSCLICCAARAVGLLNRRRCRAPAAWRARPRRPTCSARASALRARGSAAAARVSSVASSSSALSGSRPRLRRPARTVVDVIADEGRDRACYLGRPLYIRRAD